MTIVSIKDRPASLQLGRWPRILPAPWQLGLWLTKPSPPSGFKAHTCVTININISLQASLASHRQHDHQTTVTPNGPSYKRPSATRLSSKDKTSPSSVSNSCTDGPQGGKKISSPDPKPPPHTTTSGGNRGLWERGQHDGSTASQTITGTAGRALILLRPNALRWQEQPIRTPS